MLKSLSFAMVTVAFVGIGVRTNCRSVVNPPPTMSFG
jgi:hypothetical protein